MGQDRDTISKNKNTELFLCAHCKTGIVRTIPSKCPECERLLNFKVVKEDNNEKESNR